MKMKKEHFEELKAEIEKFDLEKLAEQYEKGNFPRSESVNDLQVRFVWDVYWRLPNQWRIEFMRDLYEYLNDNHIETALKRICPKITRKY